MPTDECIQGRGGRRGRQKDGALKGTGQKLFERDKQIKLEGPEWVDRSPVGAMKEVME